MPSMFPEAFGMVAAEGAACGALPICAAHSGLAEVTAILGEKLPPQVRQLLTFERGMHAVEDLAAAMTGWLELDERLRVSGRARSGRHGGRAVRLGVGGRERGQRGAGPDRRAGAGSRRGAVLRQPWPRRGRPLCRPFGCTFRAAAGFTNLASIVTSPEGRAAYAGSGWDVERGADRRTGPHAARGCAPDGRAQRRRGGRRGPRQPGAGHPHRARHPAVGRSGRESDDRARGRRTSPTS